MADDTSNQASDNTSPAPRMTVPVVEEVLQVGRQQTDTGRGVRLHKTVTEETLRVDEALQQQDLQVERVPVNAWVDGVPPAQRQEGDTLVIPVLEEVLVVEKRLRLTEEIRITVRTRLHAASERVVLRKEHVTVARFDEGDVHAEGGHETPPA